jgi:uncharacterized repeat protein (TIGR01451 family)
VWAWSAEGSKINDYDVGPGDPVISVLDGADLSITNSDLPDPVSVGERLTYTLDVTNNGTSSSTEVTVADLLPRGVRFRSARSDRGNCTLRSLRRITCNLAELQGGETATVTIVVRPTRKGTIVNTATVSRTQPPDFVLTDNSATATTEVTP